MAPDLSRCLAQIRRMVTAKRYQSRAGSAMLDQSGQETADAGMVGLKSSPLSSIASAQQSPMPEDIAWKLIELDRVGGPSDQHGGYVADGPNPGVRAKRKVRQSADRSHLPFPAHTIVPEPSQLHTLGACQAPSKRVMSRSRCNAHEWGRRWRVGQAAS
jgi:hypothetical protein